MPSPGRQWAREEAPGIGTWSSGYQAQNCWHRGNGVSSVPPHPGSMENPKSEIRKPKEGRNPKTEIRKANFSRRVAPPPPIEGKTELRKGG